MMIRTNPFDKGYVYMVTDDEGTLVGIGYAETPRLAVQKAEEDSRAYRAGREGNNE